MRVARFQHESGSGVAIVEDDRLLPLSVEVGSIAAAIQNPDMALEHAQASQPLDLGAVSLLPPVDPGARVFAVAQNYPSHAMEISKAAAPPSPVVFLKTLSSLVGHESPIQIYPVAEFMDYEAEMAVMIGQTGHALSEAEAAEVISGVTALNDGTGRDLQPITLGGKELIDWFSAKCLENSSPMGPWVVPIDRLAGTIDDLGVRCRVNGEEVQADSTASMVSSAARLASFISQRIVLRPGDVIATGTPGGVGKARGVALKQGDVVEVEVQGVGVLRNPVKQARGMA